MRARRRAGLRAKQRQAYRTTEESEQFWLDAVGPNGGLRTWASSPAVCWLGMVLANNAARS